VSGVEVLRMERREDVGLLKMPPTQPPSPLLQHAISQAAAVGVNVEFKPRSALSVRDYISTLVRLFFYNHNGVQLLSVLGLTLVAFSKDGWSRQTSENIFAICKGILKNNLC
jgi:hypothetical protein